MKILIIEDDPIKLKALFDFIRLEFPEIELHTRMSYQSGLRVVLKDNFDLLLLDMQLPNFDIKLGEDGYRHRPMAGRDILKEIKRKSINTKVVIITQYDSFTENGKISSLDEWDRSFIADFKGVYSKIIFYKPGSTAWKVNLKDLLELNND